MTPSANLNPMAALQAQPSGKKQPGPAVDDSAFSRVLSNEIAQKESGQSERNEAQRNEGRRSDAASDARRSEVRNETRRSEAQSDARQAAESGSASVPTDSPATQNAAASDPQQAAAAEANAQQPAAQPDAATLAALPDAMLAMAAAPALLIPPAGSVPASDAPLLASATGLPTPLSGPATSAPQGNPLAAAPTDSLRDAAADAQTARQPLKADFQAAMTANSAQATAAAAALPGQIAAALSPDALKPDEGRPDGVGNPLMPTTSQHAQLNALTAQTSAANNALAPSVGSTAWNQALGEKIVWMTAGALQTASLTLNPPNLGPLQVVLNVTNDQATASFFAAQPEVRQALEAALPKLREMMNEAGIQLGQATVSAEQQQQQQNEANREARRIGPAYPGAGNVDESTIQSLPLPTRHAGRGLVDTFA